MGQCCAYEASSSGLSRFLATLAFLRFSGLRHRSFGQADHTNDCLGPGSDVDVPHIDFGVVLA